MRDAFVGNSSELEQLSYLEREHQTDAGSGAALDEREHPLAKPNAVTSDRSPVGEAVDHHSGGASGVDQVVQLVYPLVDVQVDNALGHVVNVLVVDRPAEAAHNPRQLAVVLLECGQHPVLSALRAAIQEVEAHQGLADPRRSRNERGRPLPVTIAMPE